MGCINSGEKTNTITIQHNNSTGWTKHEYLTAKEIKSNIMQEKYTSKKCFFLDEDLCIHAVSNYLLFAKKCNAKLIQKWKDELVILQASVSYIEWMILRSKHQEHLFMPKNVELILKTHMLHPINYYNFSLYLFRQHMNSFDLGHYHKTEENIMILHKLWTNEFPESLENTIGNRIQHLKKILCNNYPNIDFIESIKNQNEFLSKIEQNIKYLDRTIDLKGMTLILKARYNYFKFLKLFTKHKSDCYLIPNHYIDLIWRSHMLYPVNYRKEILKQCKIFVDYNHKIGLFHKIESDKYTQELWMDKYYERYNYDSLFFLNMHNGGSNTDDIIPYDNFCFDEDKE